MGLPASRRQVALEDLRTRLSYVQIAKGYNTDAGKTILLGEEPRFGPDDPTTALALSIGDESVDVQGAVITTRVPVSVWAIVPVGTSEPLLAVEAIIVDIKEAVEIEPDGSIERSLGVIEGSSATQPKGLQRGPTRALKRQEGSTYVGAAVEYVLTFEERWGGGGR